MNTKNKNIIDLQIQVRYKTPDLNYLAHYLERLHEEEDNLNNKLMENEEETTKLIKNIVSICPHVFQSIGCADNGIIFSRCVICFHIQEGDGQAHNHIMEEKFAYNHETTPFQKESGEEQGS